jgi:prepilin signal peptidase PulO-like enzyme (type II secretory pathway)
MDGLVIFIQSTAMALLWGAIGIYIGFLICRISDHLQAFASKPTQNYPDPALQSAPEVFQTTAFPGGRPVHPPGPLLANIGVELATACLFEYVWLRFGLSANSLLLQFIGSFLILIAAIDLKYRVILNVLLLPAGIVTLLVSLLFGTPSLISVLLGGGFGLAIFASAALFRPGQLGAGDVKLAALIGLVFGFPDVIIPLLIGIGGGGAIALSLIMARHGSRSTRIPYAPFLCLGALIALLSGMHFPYPAQ